MKLRFPLYVGLFLLCMSGCRATQPNPVVEPSEPEPKPPTPMQIEVQEEVDETIDELLNPTTEEPQEPEEPEIETKPTSNLLQVTEIAGPETPREGESESSGELDGPPMMSARSGSSYRIFIEQSHRDVAEFLLAQGFGNCALSSVQQVLFEDLVTEIANESVLIKEGAELGEVLSELISVGVRCPELAALLQLLLPAEGEESLLLQIAIANQ